MIRRFLSYMPQNVWELPPADCPAPIPSIAATTSLLRIVPKDRRRPYNMRS